MFCCIVLIYIVVSFLFDWLFSLIGEENSQLGKSNLLLLKTGKVLIRKA